ncbi:hypothetical protein L1049_011950 [Liquidambar formosana]|uniref:Uncharacterized protein n=1 Tax=Liquidambar formosana TaxID=63359 RepID=A0AAP0RZ36_LIQFO
MGHRHLPNKFPMFETGQDQNRNYNTAEQPYIHMGRAAAPENGPSIHPMENTLASGVHYASQWDPESRPNDYSSSNFSMEVPHVRAVVSDSSYNPFPYLPAAGGFYLPPENNAGHAHSSYHNRNTFDEVDGGLLDPTMGVGRGPFKRKSPGISVACERGSTSRFYSAGSSSSSSEFQPEKPTSDYHIYPSGPIGLPHYTGGSLSIAGEDSLRNVRSRSRLDLELNPRRTHLSSYSSHHTYSTTNLVNHPGTVDLSSLNVDAATYEQNRISLSPAARGRYLASETSGLSHETNQFFLGGSTAGDWWMPP